MSEEVKIHSHYKTKNNGERKILICQECESLFSETYNTPIAGLVTPVSAILICSITATVCFFAVSVKVKFGVDDSLDTYPVHGVGGTVGALLTGVFATTTVNSAGKDGLLYGNPQQLLIQIAAVALTYVFAGVGTFVILKIVDAVVGLRLKPEVEFNGMDISDHGEEAYSEESGGGLSGH